jgi:hypothetical protein
MASIEKRSGGYRVKYRDPLGRQKSKSFVTKDDARRFSRQIEVDKTRGAWLDIDFADHAQHELKGVPGRSHLQPSLLHEEQSGRDQRRAPDRTFGSASSGLPQINGSANAAASRRRLATNASAALTVSIRLF